MRKAYLAAAAIAAMSAPAALKLVTIRRRYRITINTDAQRRCYNGAHFSSKLVWSPWEVLDRVPPEKVAQKLAFWRELNDFAIKERGESARCEFEAVEEA